MAICRLFDLRDGPLKTRNLSNRVLLRLISTVRVLQVQSWWYLIMSALQDDEETQKRGIVDIIYHVQHASNEKDRQMITNGSKYV